VPELATDKSPAVTVTCPGFPTLESASLDIRPPLTIESAPALTVTSPAFPPLPG
jgi:hypothetical protein